MKQPTQLGLRCWDNTAWPVLICLLGDFRVLRAGRPLRGLGGEKAQNLLAILALRCEVRVPRDALLALLWPDSDAPLARQSLNSLVYCLHKHLGPALDGAAPIRCTDGCYRLNMEAGIGVDLACFAELVGEGDRQSRAGDVLGALRTYSRALELYRGDLWTGSWSGADLRITMEREYLRASSLTLLARMADYAYAEHDYAACLDYAGRLLAADPCREDAHRLVMRCHVRLGARAQALRQYHVCVDLLRDEFDTTPEPATITLYEQVRLDPGSV